MTARTTSEIRPPRKPRCTSGAGRPAPACAEAVPARGRTAVPRDDILTRISARLRGAGLRAAVLLLVVAALAAFARADGAIEEGAAAPRDGWLTEGGCAARTAQSLARPIRGPVEAVWKIDLPAAPATEPLAFGPWIVLDLPVPAGQRTLAIHQVSDGSGVTRRQVKSPLPLLASIDWPFLVVRTGPTRVGAYRLKGGQLLEMWNTDVGEPVESLVTIAGAAFLRTQTRLCRYEIGASAPTWAHVAGARGRLAARGRHLYSVEYDDRGGASLVARRIADGERESASAIGHHGGELPAAGTEPQIVVDTSAVYVRHGLPVPARGGGHLRRATVESRSPGRLEPEGGLFESPELPLPLPGSTLQISESAEDGVTLILDRGARTGSLLAKRSDRPEWTVPVSRASSAGPVVYHPAGALDTESSRILWRPPESAPWSTRPVPVRGILLVIEGERKLCALRPAAAGSADPAPVPVGAPPPSAVDARVALRDGSVVTGRVRRDGAAFVVEGKPPRTIPATAVLLVEDLGGRILDAAPGEDLAAGLAALGDDHAGASAGKMLTELLPTRDAALLRRALAEALRVGAPAADVEKADKRIRDLTRGGKPLPADPDAVAKLESWRAGLASISFDLAKDRLAVLPADAPASVVIDLLREVLRNRPLDPEARARVRSLLPPGVQVPETFDATEWLDFVEVTRHTPVEVVHAVPPNTPGMTRDQREVGLQSLRWRSDVVGLRSRQLMIVTSVQRPGAIARCLAMGELVCATLEGFFEGGKRVRSTREPLLLVLYPSKEEYEKESAKGGHDDMGWSAGHYSPREELSRLFLPSDDAGFARISGTFAHELTHQWVEQRCPSFGTVDLRSTAKTPGYWVVEGFAEFIEGLTFDPRRASWQFDPRAGAIETVAAAAPEQFIPWKRLLGMDQAGFAGLSRETNRVVPLVHRLGFHQSKAEKHLFYDQAGATCAWLFFADDGARRAQLLEFLAGHYRGSPPPVAECFGLPEAELAERVRAWCREITFGRR